MWDKFQINKLMQYDVSTPFYCFDTDIFKQNILDLKKRFNAALCFSVKSNPWLLETAFQYADFLEVCSNGEFNICKVLEIPLSKLSVGGVAKTESYCKDIIESMPHRISVESVNQLNMLNRLAKENNKQPDILLRLTSGNQFGMSLEQIMEIFQRKDFSDINIKGIHYYSGTQRKNTEKIKEEIHLLAKIAEKFSLKEIEFGAGFGVPLYTNRPPEEFEPYIQETLKGINALSESYSVIFECGRFLTCNTGVYVTTVLDIKETGKDKYIIVDGGIHHLDYYGQIAGKYIPYVKKYPFSDENPTKYIICGSLCMVNDILAKGVMLPQVSIGDKLVFMNTGAYCVTDARSIFLSHEMPGVFLTNHNKFVCVRKQIPTYQFNFKNRKEIL